MKFKFGQGRQCGSSGIVVLISLVMIVMLIGQVLAPVLLATSDGITLQDALNEIASNNYVAWAVGGLNANEVPYATGVNTLAGDGGLTYNATTNILSTATGRGANYVIAASDAPAIWKAQADYIVTTNATDTLRTAISALPATGGTIILSSGTFNLVPRIDFKSGLNLEGQGSSTLINVGEGSSANSGWRLFFGNGVLTAYNIRLANMKFDLGNNTHATAYHFTNGENILVENLIITNGQKTSAYSAPSVDTSTNVTVRDLLVDNVYSLGTTDDTNLLVERVVLSHTHDNGLIAGNTKGALFTQNVLYDVAYGIDIGHSNNVTISQTRISYPKGVGFIHLEPTGTIWDGIMRNITIVDNIFVGSGRDYYGVLTNNVSGGTIQGLIIEGNQFVNTRYAVTLKSVSQFIISGNTFTNSDRGFEGQTVSDGLVSNNTFLNAGYEYSPIHTNPAHNVSEIGNIINGTAAGIPAIHNEGASDNNTIIGNVLSNIGAVSGSEIIKGGSNSIVKSNVGYKTENSGASVGTGAQQSIAHGLNFTPTKQQIGLWSDNDTMVTLWQSATPDATNIYVTNNISGSAWHWATVGN